ncbi:MAG: alpha/beta hydrolase [Anaerolineales bacterium]|nr:alpha/beta hydrolase [Anaerolineales bacterium]
MRTYDLDLSEIRLHVVEAGPRDGRPIVLLHGFPEYWFGWRRQLTALAAQGMRVVAPDQRGYNLSEKPRRVEAYVLPRLAGDVTELVDELGLERFVLAGHDWGGAVAWWFASHHPDRLSHLIAMSSPHPRAMADALRRDWKQRFRSLYMLFFQIPRFAEWVLGAANGWLLARGMQRSRVQGAFDRAELARYRFSWQRPGALRSMLNWYRALRKDRARAASLAEVQVPTTLVWGEQDPFFAGSSLTQSVKYCAEATAIPLQDCGHWVQHERPEDILQILSGEAPGRSQVQ